MCDFISSSSWQDSLKKIHLACFGPGISSTVPSGFFAGVSSEIPSCFYSTGFPPESQRFLTGFLLRVHFMNPPGILSGNLQEASSENHLGVASGSQKFFIKLKIRFLG